MTSGRTPAPVNASDTVFVFVCIVLSVMALFILLVGLYADGLAL